MWYWENADLKRIEGKVDQALALLQTVLKKETQIMAAIDDAITAAEAAAKSNTDAEDAVMTLLTTLSEQITNLKTAGTDPATVARIQALATTLQAKADALAAAVVAGTPSA